jgi:hypothetical protein
MASASEAAALALGWLRNQQGSDGALGYLPGQASRPEPTVLALSAGIDVPVSWLSSTDLGYARYLLPAVLRGRADAAEVVGRVVQDILVSKGMTYETDHAVIAHDTMIPGWSWVAGTSPWVEPTAYAVISLKRSGKGDNERVTDGERMLRNRQCDDGGWNYGNTRVYTNQLEGDFSPTGWTLMALPPGADVDKGFAFMATVADHPSTDGLALAILASVAHHRDPGEIVPLLLARQATDGSFSRGRVDWTALACAALASVDGGTHAFCTG